MPESPIRKLAKYADAAKLAGVHVYHLNIGQPDIKTPPQALEAVRNYSTDILEYSPSQGLKSLRTKMVSYSATTPSTASTSPRTRSSSQPAVRKRSCSPT